jgi:stearoyl-CoA desaturase (Delta-9 desaturase)
MELTFRERIVHKAFILIGVIAPFLGVIAAIVLLWNRYVFPLDIAMMLGFWFLTGLGVTIGYHRMLTHNGFEAPKWLRAFFMILGCMSMEGPPSFWTATHIRHHAHSDEDDDPHSPLHGFWHAHMGWMFNYFGVQDIEKYAPHLKQDPVVRFVDRYAMLWAFISMAGPFVIGGWTGFIWGSLVRTFITTHVTWSVNSICHTFGGRSFETTDESKNNFIVGLLAFGEGWHNNHHAFPESAFHGLAWWQVDISGMIIRTMESIGLVWNVKRVSREVQYAYREKSVIAMGKLPELRAQLYTAMSQAEHDLQKLYQNAIELSFTSVSQKEVQKSCKENLKRLRRIKECVDFSTHLKKQRLRAYLAEVQGLANVQVQMQSCPQRS